MKKVWHYKKLDTFMIRQIGFEIQYCKTGSVKLTTLDNKLASSIMVESNQWDKNLVDVTDVIFKLSDKLQPKTIIKNVNFDLFEGTRSLEVDSVKLDTCLIQLSEEELKFDCDGVIGDSNDYDYQIGVISSVANRLVCSVISWLNEYQTLPTTVLSCRYVEHILHESAMAGKIVGLKTGNELYDKILSSIVIGIGYFGKFVMELLKSGVVVEEEDLNFNNMGLDFFSFVETSQEVLNLIEESISMLVDQEHEHCKILINLLSIVKHLVTIENTLKFYDTDTTHLDELINVSISMNGMQTKMQEVPIGCFSMGIQKRLSNQYPPKNVVVPTSNYLGLKSMAEDIKNVLSVSKSQFAIETLQYAFLFNKDQQKHVVARAIFCLFMIRDDQTVLGRYTLSDFLLMHLNEYSLFGTNLQFEKLSIDQQTQLEPVLQEAVRVLLDMYQNLAQNNCRVRQGFNRQLILWDSLQAQLESIEIQTIESIKAVNATVASDTTFLPYSSWVYTMKITIMIEFILRGFELKIYKPFEFYPMFWFAYYLTLKVEYCLDSVQQNLTQKITSIQNINKKMKKSKGEKKEILRAQYKLLSSTELQTLQKNKKHLLYLTTRNSVFKSLCLSQVFQFGILKSYGLIDYKSPSQFKFVNNRLIHDLRFKPFSSIGVPELPSYDFFIQTLDEFTVSEPMMATKINRSVAYINSETTSAIENLNKIIQSVQIGDANSTMVTGTALIQNETINMCNALKKAAQAIQINSTVLHKKLTSKSVGQDSVIESQMVDLQYTTDASNFFPILTLIDKAKKQKK